MFLTLLLLACHKDPEYTTWSCWGSNQQRYQAGYTCALSQEAALDVLGGDLCQDFSEGWYFRGQPMGKDIPGCTVQCESDHEACDLSTPAE